MLPHLGSPLTAVLMAYTSFLSLSEALGRMGPSAVTLVGDLNLSDRPRGSLMLSPGTAFYINLYKLVFQFGLYLSFSGTFSIWKQLLYLTFSELSLHYARKFQIS